MKNFPFSALPKPTHVRFQQIISKISSKRLLLAIFLLISAWVNSQTTYYSKSTGDLNLTSTWGLNTNGSGTSPANFTAGNCLYIITNRSSATIVLAWTVSGAGSKVQTGDGVTGTEFIIPATSLFTGTVDVSNSATLTIQHLTSPVFGSLASGSTVNYAGTVTQAVREASYYNLVLNGGGQKQLGNASNASVSNSLIITTGSLFRLPTVNTVTFTLNGIISGGGAIVGSANSILSVNGTGPAGTITFSTTLSLYRLILDRASSGSLTLGSALTIGNDLNHINGTLDLNGNALTLNGTVTFPVSATNGVLRGSATSTLAIAASASLMTNSLLMDQSSSSTNDLGRFTLSRTGQTLTIGNALDVLNAFTLSNGTIDLNGKSLGIGGIITFPATALNGEFKGSASSSLTINGVGAITNALRLNQGASANKTLHTFIINHTGGTLVLGTDITCATSFDHSNGPVTLGTTSLVLNGNISFPLGATNGSMTGSATSTLVIGGTGSITNSLFMSQASAAARTLNYLSIDRNAQVFALGNSLNVSTFEHLNGTCSIGPSLLTLGGAITFPASSVNGSFRGSATSSINITTSLLAITNQLLMDQSSSANRTLNRFTFDRLTQTLTLGSDLVVASAYSQTNGFIDLNGRSLTAGGVIAFPATALTGYIIGSTSSSLTINGSGAITNSLRLDQTNTNSRTLHSFIIDHTAGTLIFGTDIVCTGQFSHINGTITLGATSLTLNGAITLPVSASNGSITGSATSSISIGGTGNISNSFFMSQANAAAHTLNSFIVNRVGQSFTAGNPLIVNTYDQTNGNLNLGGTLVTFNGAVTLPASAANGSIIGSPTSSLTIAASAALVTNPLVMDQSTSSSRSMSRFTISRTGQTLVLGNDLMLVDGITQTNGIIDLAGTSLTIGGTITLPVALTNGYFIGSASSSLTLNGSGVITNSLRLDQTTAGSRTLRAFTVDHTGGTLVLGNNIISDGLFAHNNGTITMVTTLLTLNGDIIFPVSASNGSITGSATSSLLISGTGSISNSLFMSQVNAAARTFNNLTINRANAALSLGNPLTVNTFSQSNGSVKLNGTLLTLSGVITLPATVGNGAFIGSATSSLLINGAGAITNALRMDQGSSPNLSLYDLTMSRAGQTLTIGNPIEIRNAITPSVGTIAGSTFIKLKADASRSGMIGVVGGALTGTVTVETFAPGAFTGWTQLGPSGVTGLTVANWEGQWPMTCQGCTNNEYSAGGYFVSIQRYNEAGVGSAAYVPLSYTSALTRGNGYWVYLGTGGYTTAPVTYSVSGPPVTGIVTIPISVSNSSFNLVSNPYAAPIDWDLVVADAANLSAIGGAVYFYNPDIGQSISYAGGVSNPTGYITNGVVPMGQGFYVTARTNTNITFRESHKSTENTNANPLLRSSQATSIGNVFRLSILGPDNAYDETTIRFHADATTQFDRLLDARKMFQTPGYLGTGAMYSKYTTISSRFGEDDYSINSLPLNTSGDYLIPVLARASKTGSYTFSAHDIQNLSPDACVILHDRLLNKDHDLRTGSYMCLVADSTSAVRFDLRICTQQIVGITENSENATASVLITKNSSGVLIKNARADGKTAKVSAYNLSGQKLMEETEMEDELLLPFTEIGGQIVLVKVQTADGQIVKKISLE